MTRLTIVNAWYCDALPSGAYVAALLHQQAVQTHLGTLPTGPRDLLYVRGTDATGSYKFAGQSSVGGEGTLEYTAPYTAPVTVGNGYGNNPVLYLADGTLMQGAPQYGAEGLRYQADDGSIVTADQTKLSPDGRFANYTTLGGVTVGQDQKLGRGAVLDVGDGALRMLEAGSPVSIRMTHNGDNFAFGLAMSTGATGQAVLIWATRAELAQLPIVADPPPPPHIGPTTPPRAADGRLYDLRSFFLCDPTLQPRSGPSHPINQVTVSSDLFAVVKFNAPHVYELWGHDDNWLYQVEDAGGNPEVSFTDPRLFPTHMAIGPAHAFDTGQHTAIFRQWETCQVLHQDPWSRFMWILAVYDGYDWGPDLGNRPTIITVYDPSGGFHIPGRYIELGYYALNAGGCQWEAHHAEIVYASGKPVFSEASLSSRTQFYLLNGPNVQPIFTGCVPIVCPHYPPLTPPVPPIPPTPPEPPPMSNPTDAITYDQFTQMLAHVQAALHRPLNDYGSGAIDAYRLIAEGTPLEVVAAGNSSPTQTPSPNVSYDAIANVFVPMFVGLRVSAKKGIGYTDIAEDVFRLFGGEHWTVPAMCKDICGTDPTPLF